MLLAKLGWNSFFEDNFRVFGERGLVQGRVVKRSNDSYIINDGMNNLLARLTGRFLYQIKAPKDFPAIGDWVAFEVKDNSSIGYIHAVLPRKSCFSRKLAISGGRKMKQGIIDGGSTEEQVIASNIDTIFIVCGLDSDFDLRRIERYLTLAYNSGASPVILLNKMDVCTRLEEVMEEVNKVALGVSVFPISAEKEMNMASLSPFLKNGQSIAFLGSSGVGKSTITNLLLGQEKQKKQEISKSTGKGKHTTTSAELISHSSGFMIIDTPGLREVQLWGEENILEESFSDITKLFGNCRYSNCKHVTEPDCAVKQAIEDGTIAESRYKSYQKQSDELQRLNLKIKNLEVQVNKRKKRNLREGY
ncbi:ribosome small subunit-dependent GTPase A [Bacillus infantis]|uniref:ribosome small subunit-dependent GTPase A n=1 Tax=Bacillus infantis TaxID=324767 RepID=UPI001CD72D56|nr:ribosome small subunit-dependent GTPase A [Bacillus infantis]MCA1041209.1 ribosome small subunit-dependent GTPase A [Bacillus infantis]